MWYILETEGNVPGSIRMGSVQIIGVGDTLAHAQLNAVHGLIDAVGKELELTHPLDAVDFAYLVQYSAECGRTVVAVQAQDLKPYNK